MATRRSLFPLVLSVALVIAFPVIATAFDQLFYVSFATRLAAYALAATSLNLLLGYGGMLSFGHAAYLGTGAYTVAILSSLGVSSAWASWPAAAAVSGLTALLFGAVCLRTRGVYFIMITLAFSQMMHYLLISLRALGGEDGLNLAARSEFGLGLDLKNDVTFYYVTATILAVVLYLLHRLVRSRFGRVIRAVRENETRAEAIGFPTYGYKLLCFVVAGGVAGLAGALFANQNGFVSPHLLHWTQSGTLMLMVILGGVGHPFGGVIGPAAFLLLEEVFSRYTIHWQLALGLVLLGIVLFAERGIAGLLERALGRRGENG